MQAAEAGLPILMIIIVNTAEALLYKPVKHANAHLHDHVITSLPSCPNRRKQANKRHVAAACCRLQIQHRSACICYGTVNRSPQN